MLFPGKSRVKDETKKLVRGTVFYRGSIKEECVGRVQVLRELEKKIE